MSYVLSILELLLLGVEKEETLDLENFQMALPMVLDLVEFACEYLLEAHLGETNKLVGADLGVGWGCPQQVFHVPQKANLDLSCPPFFVQKGILMEVLFNTKIFSSLGLWIRTPDKCNGTVLFFDTVVWADPVSVTRSCLITPIKTECLVQICQRCTNF